MSYLCFVFFFKQKTAYEMRISDWSSDVCSSDLPASSLAVAIYETRRRALEDSEEFFRRVSESDLRGNGDPLVTLTRRVQRDIAEKRTISQARGLFYLFRTWNAFRTGEVMQKIQVGGGNGDRKSTRLNSSH